MSSSAYRTNGGGNEYLATNAEFTPSSYEADLTMDGTAQSVALASGVGVLRVTNRGVTTEAIRIAFGTSAVNAEANLNIAAAAATTGVYIGAAADSFSPTVMLGVPKNGRYYAVANDVASDTQAVSVEQGI